MLPPSHPLIEAVIEPLTDNAEQRLAARAMLEETFDKSHPAVAETLDRMENIHARKHPNVFPLIVGIVAAIALLLSILPMIPAIRLWDAFYNRTFFEAPEPPPLLSFLTPQQRLLFPDPALSNSERLKLLVDTNPDDPAFYTEYASDYVSENKTLPPGYFETVARIAPKNSYFLYYAAGQIGGNSIKGERKKKTLPAAIRYEKGIRLSPLPTEREYEVIDDATFEHALSLIKKARHLPDFETYINTMTRRRVPLLPDKTLTDRLRYQSYAWGGAGGLISLRKITDILATQAQLLSKEGSKEDFISLVGNQRHFVAGFSKNPDVTLLGELVHSIIISGTSPYFQTAAESLGLNEIAASYAAQKDALQQDRDEKTIREADGVPAIIDERGSLICAPNLPLLSRQASHPTEITEAQLRPLRLVEHDIASRLEIIAAALIQALACIPVFFFRYHSPRPIRLPAIRLSKLLRPSDWVWIISLGIILPIVAYLAINRLTPLGGREYSLQHFLFFFPSVQILAILFTLLLAPAVLIRWRLGKRLAPFGIHSRPTLLPDAMLGLILIWSVSVFPLIRGVELSRNLLIALAAVPALWVGNIFLNFLLAFIGKPAGRIPRVATATALLPAYAVGIIALCLTLPIFTSSEKHWMKQDTLFRIDPDAPDLGAYEYKVAAQKRKELNAILMR